MRQRAEERMREVQQRKQQKVEEKYGKQVARPVDQLSAALVVPATEAYVEYDAEGRVVTEAPKPIPRSSYVEDVFPGNHSAVFGSWYDRERKAWGFACCRQCEFSASCTKPLEA